MSSRRLLAAAAAVLMIFAGAATADPAGAGAEPSPSGLRPAAQTVTRLGIVAGAKHGSPQGGATASATLDDVTLTQDCAPTTIPTLSTTECQITVTNVGTTDRSVALHTQTKKKLRVDAVTSGSKVDDTQAMAAVDLDAYHPGVPTVDDGSTPVDGYLPLDAFGVTPIPIGDEEFITFNVPAFVYSGASYTRLGVNSNGYIVVGQPGPNDNVCCPLGEPHPSEPNNVLAPVWTDLDGSTSPGIYATVLSDGTDSWLAIEWRVKVYLTSSLRTFQAWIGINGVQDITYAYAAPQADPGFNFLVGAENSLGEGQMVGILPGNQLRVTSTPAGPAESFTYTVTAQGTSTGKGKVSTHMSLDGVTGVVAENDTITITTIAN